MKKIALFALILFQLSGFAQNLELLFEGAQIGDTLTLHATNLLTKNDFYIDVVNHSERATIEVKVKKTHLYIVEGTENSFCFGTSCFDSYISPIPFSINPLDTFSYATQGDQAFHISYFPFNNIGTSYIRYTFFNVMDPDNDTVSFVAEIISENTSLIAEQNQHLIQLFPNPVINDILNVEYNIEGGVPTYHTPYLLLTDIFGKVIYTEPLTQLSGTIKLNTSRYVPNVYFLSFINNGKKVVTHKVIIP